MCDVDFSDMDDLDSAPIAKSSGPDKQDRLKYPCMHCNSTGKWVSPMGRKTGKCHACNGRGHFFTSPEQRDRAKKKRASRKAKKAQQLADQAAIWREQNQPLVEFLESVRSWNSFASSLLVNLDQYGSLKPNQVTAALRMKDKMEQRKKESDKNAPVIELTAINQLFDTAKSNGLKKPKLRILDLVISIAPTHGTNAGCLYVKHCGEYAGKITPEGRFFKTRSTPDGVSDLLADIARDPFEQAKVSGVKTGRCSCCGQELTNPESIASGIGPICAGRWGW